MLKQVEIAVDSSIVEMIKHADDLKKQLESIRAQELNVLKQLNQVQHAVRRLGALYGTCKKELTTVVKSYDPLDKYDRTITVKVGQIVCFNQFPTSMTAVLTVGESSWADIDGTEEYFDFFFTKQDVNYINCF